MRKKRTFNLLIAAQSLSAFGDNAVYSVIVGMLLQSVAGGKLTPVEFGVVSAVYANCFFLPYVLFAPVVGWITDHFEKRSVLFAANLIKAAGAAIGCAGILSGINLNMLSYLVIGTGAAIYSPSKYGIIPELKNEAELVKANAAIEMTTIVSILTGILGGSLLVDHLRPEICFLVLFVIYGMAAVINHAMDRSGICNHSLVISRSFSDFMLAAKTIIADKLLLVAVFGTAIFWGFAAFTKLNLQTWGQSVLKLQTATEISMLVLWLSIGIILGSILAGKFLKTGAIKGSWRFGFFTGIVVCVMVLFYIHYAFTMAELILIGMLGGLFVIPLNAEVQARSGTGNIGKVISIQNCYENGAMLLSTGIFWLFNKLSFSSTSTFLIIGGFLCLTCVLWLKPLLKKS
jgi:LPLT family lysophospholipid transporter-like MFS transporter